MFYLASDVGGTFVDLVLVDTKTGVTYVDKVPSTGASAAGILAGIKRLTARAQIGPEDVDVFVHGFTIATNAWLERRGAELALVVTKGFRDVLEIGTQQRENLYNLVQVRQPPIVSRSRVVEVDERIDVFGAVVTPLDAAEIAAVTERVAALRPEAVAIALIFAHVNSAHETALAEALRAALPGVPVYRSFLVNPEVGEYARTNTVATSAYVGPSVERYVGELERGLGGLGFRAPLRLMRSDGGVATALSARENPGTMLLSGPAGGVIAAATLADSIGAPDLITFDMGGTSADFSLIEAGTPRLSTERIFGGEVLRIPTLDIETISAGGGSIAGVDHAGGLHVGPRSAGARPGPACYGRGGTDATLTDALLVLGILDEVDFAGGDLRLDGRAAAAAIGEKVAEPLGLSVEDAALGMVAVANAHMRQAIRALSVERGHDIRRFSLLAFGGAGPVFAALMQQELDILEVLVPPRPGVFAAQGLLLADLKHRLQRPFAREAATLDAAALRDVLQQLRRELDDALARDGVEEGHRQVRFTCDMRYVGQFHHLGVALRDERTADWWDPAALAASFHAQHETSFGHSDSSNPVEIIAVRGQGTGQLEKPAFAYVPRRSGPALKPRGKREVRLASATSRISCPVYDRAELRAGDVVAGPAIVSQSDTTVLIVETQVGTVDDFGVIHIRSKEA